MVVLQQYIGIDPLWVPSGFLGSPLISSLLGSNGETPINSNLILDYKTPSLSWPGITVLFWLRFDDNDLDTERVSVLVSAKYKLISRDIHHSVEI